MQAPPAKTCLLLTLLLTLLAAATLLVAAQVPLKPQDVIQAMVDNENAAAARHDRYIYLSNERSGRTGGHLWTERVVETEAGRMRLLQAVDGQPLTPQQTQAERARLEGIRQHPEVFIKHEQGTRAEEKRVRDLMAVLPRDFIFENIVLDRGQWRMTFRPNPGYTPSGIEERVLCGMAGNLVIDAHDLRLAHIEFHLVQDVSIGWGFVADVHQGTNFVSDRQQIDGHWHTLHVATQVRAKAVFFKTVDLNVDVYRSEFVAEDHNISVPEAASLLLSLR